MWFPNKSDTNWPSQSQKMAGGLKFQIYEEEEEVYYLCSENKCADQLCRLLVFLRGGSFIADDLQIVSLFLLSCSDFLANTKNESCQKICF